MDLKEFKQKYLSYYLLLESDFESTFNYVSVESDNYKTYSNEYLKLLLAVGSEIDVMKRFLAHLFEPSIGKGKNVNQVIEANFPDIRTLEVCFRASGVIFKPWDYPQEPDWWTAYNEIKHNRMSSALKFDKNKKYYQYANLENVLLALSALFTLELICYWKIAMDNGDEFFVPALKSLFSIKNSKWQNVYHGAGMVVINGTACFAD